MCTVNSLRKAKKNVLSLGAILSLLVFSKPEELIAKNSSRAHSNAMSLSIDAPLDRVITIKNLSSCDTTITLDPAIIQLMPGCSLRSITTSTGFQTLSTNGGTIKFIPGVYKILYCAEDICNNKICDSMKLIVLDAQLPNMVCTPEYIINLNSDGEGIIPAGLFDGGSSDNCGHLFFKAKRMNKPVGYDCSSTDNPNYKFDDEVKFCCKDISQSPLRIIVRVYDIFPGDGVVDDSFYLNHFVQCMVMVTVGDKIGPSLWIPKDITVSCGTDIDSLFKSSQASYSDNCFPVSLDEKITKRLNSCGYGTIERMFTARDSSGLTTVKTQVVTILANSHFNGLDPNQLKWPDHKTVYTCRVDLNVIDGGVPILNESECDNILVSKKDNLFSFDRGGVCGKILRTWQVINWCIYNPALRPNPNISENGYYSFVQEIKIMDTIPPVFDPINDITISTLSATCGNTNVSLSPVSASDCGTTSQLIYKYSIDINSDGSIDLTGNGPQAKGMLPNGNHLVHYYVEDSCHNESQYIQHLTLKDAKPPSITLLYGLSTTLQDMNGRIMAMVNAAIFNNKSSDNCTPNNLLRYSFSKDINDSIRIFTCDEIGVNELEVYVFDECGNYSFTKTFISVLDLEKLCPGSITTHNITGNIQTQNGIAIPSAEVMMKDSFHYEIKHTGANGEYSFQNIPDKMSFILQANCNENVLDGISTADIVRIQQHILGKNYLNSPYDILAADVDLNGRISSADVALLRKLILGIIDELPSKQTFLFVNKKVQFTDPQNPWNDYYKNSNLFIKSIQNSMSMDFTGIKLGDINNSLKSRTNRNLKLYYKVENNDLLIYSKDEMNLLALNLSLEINGLSETFLNTLELQHSAFSYPEINLKNNRLQILATENNTISIKPEVKLFTFHIPFSNENINDLKLKLVGISEFVDQHIEEGSISLEEELTDANEFKVLLFGPNPIEDKFEVMLESNVHHSIQLELIDQSGKIVNRSKFEFSKNIETIRISKEEFKHSGIFIVRLISDKNIWSQKVLIK